ncbi:MAG: photosystem II oxygen evolving complex protein PsbP [Okeania sp. SIO2G4]|uniref:photosystem II reaction center PsbP n=1 Tax=unclassified Okeania TaxID=2634635 RepID=UPI0013B92DB8|nr:MULTISPECIES: photosystem II reaction center PsbP [unclassified Okeania]NEP04317.1 photosystem II oxygen evolving complex protein PsbP [Okeania sp. SIO4D6]NEP38434.1 photosystem II oxygen evolving complex protein PsbP [Okeania sp. SIO2H7]NEP72300.1 photosystem II oxygen evolving complex protein PsbP [Okeania sp. SIO2G5]NEP94267.1 photosystem II oxygen evolving complex protein PsbP [Okeania sp. SIO2F5]NEQ90980.1 photosystem II oxygen evolving complex protein PsbP [Okeania sp. SIO2G4]
MLKKIVALFLVAIALVVTGCVSIGGGLQSFVDTTDGYEFLYPNGWLEVKVSDGPDVVFHDLVEATENVSVVISPVVGDQTLADLGTPTEVGYKLSKNAIAPADSGREAELVSAEAREYKAKTYYQLEYAVKLADGRDRHNLASVGVSRGKLFTINISTTEARWQKVHDKFEQVINSFSIY